MRKLMVLALVVLAGCSGSIGGDTGAEPPATFSIDPAFTSEQADVFRSAVSAWCDAAGYCPAEVAWSGADADGAVALVQEYPNGRASDEAALNDGGRILVRASRTDVLGDSACMWNVLAHEIGHYRIAGHREAGLMTDHVCAPTASAIDGDTLAAWGGE